MRSRSGPTAPQAGEPSSRVPAIPSGRQISSASSRSKGWPDRAARLSATISIPAVGVDPLTARTAEDRVAVEPEPDTCDSRCRIGRSWRSGRLVQIEQAALHGVERGQRDEQLVTDAHR